MSAHTYRFFAAGVEGGRARLSPADRHHLERVLRLRRGDPCEAVAGGRVWRARVADDGLELLAEVERGPAAPPVAVWLAQPGARSDTAVEKLTELGVTAIGALASERVKGAFTPARLERWRRIAAAAAKQARRADVPRIEGPATVADAAGPEALVLAPDAAEATLAEALAGRAAATLLVGPEPGFSPADVAAARAAGAVAVTLGPPLLRTETAAVAAAALALRDLGWLR